MTLSLLHYNPNTGLSACISATGGVSVGGYVNHAKKSLGTCATQGLFTNPWYPNIAFKMLERHKTAKQIVEYIKSYDKDYNNRQFIIIDKQGQSAVINGNKNEYVVSSQLLHSFASAGNMLANNQVIDNFINSFLEQTITNLNDVLKGQQPLYKENYQQQLSLKLINSLEQAILTGGDKRGTFSAALRIESPTFAPIDIRVDWADNGQELIEKLKFINSKVHQSSFQSFLSQLPTK